MIAKKLATIASLAALVLALAACDSQPAAPTTPGVSDIGTPTPGNDIPISPADTATIPANATAAPGSLFSYQMTGGFAGFNTTLTVQGTGEYTLTERGEQPKTGKLDEAKLNEIKQQLDAVRGLSDLKDEYNEGNVADDIYRTLIFDQSGTLKAVTVAEQGGKNTAPQPLQQLIDTINSFVESQ
ncbi:MAG: hypothetical protein M3328_09380 [Chloroflexota bacterium]|nr:hypothetical protein [Chloroflexota bacterium]